MYRIMTNQFGNTYRSIDCHSVRIGDRLAWDMPLSELHQEVKKLGVPGVEPGRTGRQETVVRLGVFQQEELEKRGYKHDRDGNPYLPEVASKQRADTPPATVGGGALLGTKP